MGRLALSMVPVKGASPKRDRKKKILIGRQVLMDLTGRIMKAASLKGAARIVRDFAATLPRKKWKGHSTWQSELAKLALAIETRSPLFTVIVEDGNGKLPFAAFSVLPKWMCPGAGECLSFCYSFTAWRYPAAWSRQVQNTLFLRFAPEIILSTFLALPQDITLRLYVDGDFDCLQTIHFWMTALAMRPDIRAYGYSKSWDLLWEYAHTHTMPENYWLNLSSGGRPGGVSRQDMLSLSFTRGDFLSLDIDYHPIDPATGHPFKGNIGFKRYDDPLYHRAVREAGRKLGLKVWSCPGRCGECAGGAHACGNEKFKGTIIAIGIH